MYFRYDHHWERVRERAENIRSLSLIEFPLISSQSSRKKMKAFCVVSCRMCVFAIYRMKDVCKWDLEIQEWCNNSEMEFDIVDLCMILLSSLSHQMQCIQNCLFWLNWVRTFFAAIHRRLDLSPIFLSLQY